MNTLRHFLASHSLYKNSTLYILQGLPRLLYTVVPEVGPWDRELGCRVRAMLFLLTDLSIWLSLYLRRGPFGTRHAATVPASFLMPSLDSVLTLGFRRLLEPTLLSQASTGP